MENYYQNVLHKNANFDALVSSISAIAQNNDIVAVGNILELIAVAAVTCDQREKFVRRIMNMSHVNQVQMMQIVESSLAKIEDFNVGVEDENKKSMDIESVNEYEVSVPINNEITGIFRHAMESLDEASVGLDRSILSEYSPMSREHPMDIIKERNDLHNELLDARRKLTAQKCQADILAEHNELSQNKIRTLAEDLQLRLEKRDEELNFMEVDLNKSKKIMEEKEAKCKELSEMNTMLADELDVSNAKAAQLRKAEATLSAYRKKLEGVGVMSQQMIDLEDQSATYLKQIMDLETEVKKLPELQRNVQQLKKRLNRVEKEKQEAIEEAHIKTSEINNLKADLSAADKTKKKYAEELISLRSLHNGPSEVDSGVCISGLSLTSAKSISEMKEKLKRFEIENKDLKSQIEQKKLEFTNADMLINDDTSGLHKYISQLKEQIKEKETEKRKICSDKEKLEAYTKKTLSKFQQKYLVALQECKVKLKEKHDKIEAFEVKSASEKSSQKKEERLLSSAIYELGLTIMQQRLREG